MSEAVIRRIGKIKGLIQVPGDKSISHRVALLSLLCTGQIEARGFADGEDCAQSLAAVRALGGTAETDGDIVRLTPPPGGIPSPLASIDCGNSGTTMRLLTGLLAGAGVTAGLIGDASLTRRPMLRIAEPLRQMNASVEVSPEGTAPIQIRPGNILPLDYTLPVASAQVKSALLLAGLASGCQTVVREKVPTRDHTERLIKHFGGDLTIDDVTADIIPDPDDPRRKKRVLPTDRYKRSITLAPRQSLSGAIVDIPGDISTAAFFIAAALMIRGSQLIIKQVGLNPTRLGFVNLLKVMDANIAIKNRTVRSGEPVGDIEVTYGQLKPRKISGESVAGLIDELPILAVLASGIQGTTIVRDAGELRHKESDRITAVVHNLRAMGVKVGEFPDGYAVEGCDELNGAEIDSFGDHRIAMAFAVAGAAAHGRTVITGSEAVAVSCPRFLEMLEGLRS